MYDNHALVIEISSFKYLLIIIFIILKIFTFKQELNNFTGRGYEFLRALAAESTD